MQARIRRRIWCRPRSHCHLWQFELRKYGMSVACGDLPLIQEGIEIPMNNGQEASGRWRYIGVVEGGKGVQELGRRSARLVNKK